MPDESAVDQLFQQRQSESMECGKNPLSERPSWQYSCRGQFGGPTLLWDVTGRARAM